MQTQPSFESGRGEDFSWLCLLGKTNNQHKGNPAFAPLRPGLEEVKITARTIIYPPCHTQQGANQSSARGPCSAAKVSAAGFCFLRTEAACSRACSLPSPTARFNGAVAQS